MVADNQSPSFRGDLMETLDGDPPVVIVEKIKKRFNLLDEDRVHAEFIELKIFFRFFFKSPDRRDRDFDGR